MLSNLPDTLHKDADSFRREWAGAWKKVGMTLGVPVVKAILQALSEKDATVEFFLDREGSSAADSKLRDHERVPRPEGDDPLDDYGVPASVQEFFDRQPRPYRPDAWINEKQGGQEGWNCGNRGP